MKSLLVILALLLLSESKAYTKDPDCSGVEHWPTKMAFVQLKNAGRFYKDKNREVSIGKIGEGLYRQIHHVTFTEKSGKAVEVITVNNASNEERSMTEVDVFVVATHLEK